MASPVPEPTNIRRLRGNPGKRPFNDAEPQPGPPELKPPAWLPVGLPRQFWKDLGPMLERMGVLTEADELSLAQLCRELQRYVEANDAVDRLGMTYEMVTRSGDGMTMQRPEVGIANSAFGNALRLMDRFGMSPSMRTRLKVERRPAQEDPLDALRRSRGA